MERNATDQTNAYNMMRASVPPDDALAAATRQHGGRCRAAGLRSRRPANRLVAYRSAMRGKPASRVTDLPPGGGAGASSERRRLQPLDA
jgi:hypothetical protein